MVTCSHPYSSTYAWVSFIPPAFNDGDCQPLPVFCLYQASLVRTEDTEDFQGKHSRQLSDWGSYDTDEFK